MTPRNPKDVHVECEAWGAERVQTFVDTNLNDPERMQRLEWLNGKLRAMRVTEMEWAAVPAEVRRAMKAGWTNGMPALASALYGRWWQLESWLRSLVYVELRSARGKSWVDALPKISEDRQIGDEEFHHMPTPDAQNRLAYADASTLFKITFENWDIFKSSLPPRNIWSGRVDELKAIRNRIGHCRRPHGDDLVRLEQTLRDLEGGAFRSTSAFNNQWHANEQWTDAVADGWVRKHHDTAIRLINHAELQYDTIFELRYSRRPWAGSLHRDSSIVGVPGHIWHAFWYCRGGRPFHLDKFWRDIESCRETVLTVCADSPSSLNVAFSSMDDPNIIADAIGRCFDAALYSIGHGLDNQDYLLWRDQYADLDSRIHAGTPWSSVDESMRGVSIFGA